MCFAKAVFQEMGSSFDCFQGVLCNGVNCPPLNLLLSSPALLCAGESHVPAELLGPSLFPLPPPAALGTCQKALCGTGWQEGVALTHACGSDVCNFSDLLVFFWLGHYFVSSEVAETT